MLDVVIDTNIVMSGIGWSGPPSDIVNAWAQVHGYETQALL